MSRTIFNYFSGSISKSCAIALSLHSDESNTTYSNMMICDVPSIYRYAAMFARQGTSRAKIGRHFLQRLFSSDAKSIFDMINRDAIPLFQRHYQIAIAPNFRQYRYTARFNQRDPTPTSLKDYCNSLALSYPAIENSIF